MNASEQTPDVLKPPAKKKPLGCLGIGLIFINIVMSLAICGYASELGTVTNPFFGWLTLLALIGFPFLLRKKFNVQWRKLYLWALTWAVGLIVFTSIEGVYKNTPQYAAYEQKKQAEAEAGKAKEAESEQKESAEAVKRVEHHIGESILVGYTRYQVNSISWRRRLGNSYFGKDADSRYLLVHMSVKNEDKESRMVPNFTLRDETGASYDESSDKMYLGSEAVFLTSLNPGVQKRATLVFDVPPDHHYWLQTSGGYWSTEDALIKLN